MPGVTSNSGYNYRPPPPSYGGSFSGSYGGGAGEAPSGNPAMAAMRRRVSPPSRAGTAAMAAGAPQMPYQPQAPAATGMVNSLRTAGEGLLDPGSDYSTRLMEELTKDIGQGAAARGRGATLDAMRSGYGGGQSAELLETQGDVSRAGTEAMGEAGAAMRLAAPKLGGELLSPALSGELGLQGQRLSGFLSQQGLQAQQQQDEIRNQMEADRLREEAMWRELSLFF